VPDNGSDNDDKNRSLGPIGGALYIIAIILIVGLIIYYALAT